MVRIDESGSDAEITVREFLRRKRAEGLKIDPTTAQVFSDYIVPGDPYGLFPVPGDACGDKVFFALDPERQIAVSFDDLPESTRAALLNKYRHRLYLTIPAELAKHLT